MNKDKALEILKDYIQPDGGLFCLGHYLAWSPGEKEITLDCQFDADELEAIVWWMRNPPNAQADLPRSKSVNRDSGTDSANRG